PPPTLPTRRLCWVALLWSATAGFLRPEVARGVGRSGDRCRWASARSTAGLAVWSLIGIATPPRTSPLGRGPPESGRTDPRTAKRAAGSPMPLEGKALVVALATVQPVPVNGEPTFWRMPGPTTSVKDGVRAA